MNDWKVNTMREADQDRNPIQYVVSGLIERPSVNVVYGDPDSLETMLLLDMSACVVKELPWLRNSEGAEVKPTTKVGVLWLDVGNDVQRTHLRMQAIGSHYSLSESDGFYYVSMPAGGLDMSDHVSVESLAKLISPDVGLIVIDNPSYMLACQNPYEMARVVSSLRMLAEQHHLALVILNNGYIWNEIELIEAGVDLILEVNEGSSNKLVVMPLTKSFGNKIADFGAQFCEESDETSPKQAWFEGVDASDVAGIWVDDFQNDTVEICVSSVLLYKGGYMDIVLLGEYVFVERERLKRDPSYKSEWVPIATGSYAEMQKEKEEIEKKGLGDASDWWIGGL